MGKEVDLQFKEMSLYEQCKEAYKGIVGFGSKKRKILNSSLFLQAVQQVVCRALNNQCNLTSRELHNVKFMISELLNSNNFDERCKYRLRNLQYEIREITIDGLAK